MTGWQFELHGDYERSRSLEWLETNGLGGFSSSTIIGLNTRRYHGLLTAALRPPVGRVVLLSVAELLRALVEGVCELESSKAVKAN